MRLLKEIRTLMANYHVKSGIYHHYRNEFKQAVDFFKKALRDEPKLSDSERVAATYYLTQTFVNSAERLERQGELEGAVEEYSRAVEVSPDFPDIRYRLGLAMEALGRPADAVEEYRRAIECNAEYLDAWIALGFCLMGLDRREEASKAFAEALELKIKRYREPAQAGMRHLKGGRIDQARELFHDAFRSSPQKFDEHYRAALEFLKREEYENALSELDLALEQNPRFADLHNFRGVASCELGQLEEGIASLRRSAELNRDFLVPRLNLAFALLRTGDYKEAETELEAVLAMDPTQHAASVKLEELRSGRERQLRRAAPRGSVPS
jgi:tetratricopeptide (TPR) repeat protein